MSAEITAGQSRPLEPMYPVICFDALRVKVRLKVFRRSQDPPRQRHPDRRGRSIWYLVDVESGVLLDVETIAAHRTGETEATKAMLE